MGNDEKRGEKEPVRRQDEGSRWSGEPAEEAERQRGAGRGHDEPEKQPPPPRVDEVDEEEQ